MVWGVLCYIFGAIAIIGPILCAFWYFGAARRKLKALIAMQGEGGAGTPPGPDGEA